MPTFFRILISPSPFFAFPPTCHVDPRRPNGALFVEPNLPALLFPRELRHAGEDGVQRALDRVPLLLPHLRGELIRKTRVPQAPLVLSSLLLLRRYLLLVRRHGAILESLLTDQIRTEEIAEDRRGDLGKEIWESERRVLGTGTLVASSSRTHHVCSGRDVRPRQVRVRPRRVSRHHGVRPLLAEYADPRRVRRVSVVAGRQGGAEETGSAHFTCSTET